MKKSILCLIVLLLIIFMIGYSNNQTFNDVTSMEAKTANELDIEQISIFDLQDVDEYRFVGYTFDNHLGFAVFKQDENGDYIFEIAKKADKMISRAKDIFYDYHISYWIVLSNNENLNTIQRKIKYKSDSNEEITTLEVTECPSINVLKFRNEDHEGEYNFYDVKGNLIQ